MTTTTGEVPATPTPLPSDESIATCGRPLAGVVATAAALGVSELLAGILPGATSLVAAVGQVVIDLQPAGAKDFVVALFGTNDKLALELFIVAVALVVGAALGLVARRRYDVARGRLRHLRGRRVRRLARRPVGQRRNRRGRGGHLGRGGRVGARLAPRPLARRRSSARPATYAPMPDWSRRSFIIRAGGVGIGAVAAGALGRNLLERQRTAPIGDGPTIPPASVTVPALSADADLSTSIAGLTPIVVPTARFYRIDTSLLTPNLSTSDWTLRIHGLVDRETVLTWAQLIDAPDVRTVRDALLRQQ